MTIKIENKKKTADNKRAFVLFLLITPLIFK